MRSRRPAILSLSILFGAIIASIIAGCGPAADDAAEQSRYEPSTESESTVRSAETGKGPASAGDSASETPPSGSVVVAEKASGETVPADDGKGTEPAAAGETQTGEAASETATEEHPFPYRFAAPDFPPDAEWLNCGGPLRKRDLKGKFVLLDFWTYCCINCMHILPELKKLERAYPRQLVVIGVHSAKFEGEKDSENIEEAILRYEIEHPVINDAEHRIWNAYEISSWPTIYLIDPEGNAVGFNRGEIRFEDLDRVIARALPYYRQRNLLDESPVHFNLTAHRQQGDTPLRFPGKVLADEPGSRLFISDSNHNRIVIATLDGELIETIGSGAIGSEDGDFASATFNHPQGMALLENSLYVADTENHMLRRIDLAAKTVTTIAGTGVQGRVAFPGMENVTAESDSPQRWVGKPRDTGLNSPWDLWIHDQNLYIAMAGPHQIWKMPLDESEIGPYAGNGREDIVDGELLPPQPYALGFASFAQPSGLSSDGQWLYVADSEGSSIRAVPFDSTGEVRTVVGTSQLPGARLFTFGDRDGTGLVSIETDDQGGFVRDENGDIVSRGPLLQHALGVTYHAGQNKLFVADTYNNKVKVIDAATGETKTLAGTGEPGNTDEPARFDEPGGLSHAGQVLYVADTNNHVIRTVDTATGKVVTLELKGLAPPAEQAKEQLDLTGAAEIRLDRSAVKPLDGKITLEVELKLPQGWKINDLAPMVRVVQASGEEGPVDRAALGKKPIQPPSATFSVALPVTGQGTDQLSVSMNYFYCQDGGEGLCKVGSVVFTVPLEIRDDAEASSVKLLHEVTD